MPGDDELLFLRVVDAGSLKAAAHQLGVDPSTVSRRVRSLEERVGARLLRRSTRRTGPTDAGLRYSEGLRRLVDEQQALEADVSGETRQIRGILRIAAPVGFGARFVVPVVDRMMAESPELEVALELGSDTVDLVERGLDVAVRVGRLQDSALRARRLASVPRVIVAGPAWVARHGMPTTAEELEALPGRPWIAYRRSGGVPTFPLTCPDGRTLDQPVRAGIHVNSVEGMRALVLAGRGLQWGPRWAYAEDLRAGRVVELLPDHALRPFPAHAVYPAGAWLPAKVRRFIDLCAETFPSAAGLTA